MTTQTARQHANTAANRNATASFAEKDARSDRQTAVTAIDAQAAQIAANNATRAAMTARDAAAAAESHAAAAERQMQDAADAAIHDDDLQVDANNAEDAWIDARRSATEARLAADMATRHAGIAQETARNRRSQEEIAAKTSAARLQQDATAAAIATGETERAATAQLHDAAALFADVASKTRSEQTAAFQSALLGLECAAISLGDATKAHAAALIAEQDAYDATPTAVKVISASDLSYVATLVKSGAIGR